jgi:hypothetical protein
MGKSKLGKSRALSVRRAAWQSLGLALASVMTCIAMPASAVPGGDVATLDPGRYVCELPGDAGSVAGRKVPEENFRIVSASSYKAEGTIGSYLLTGDNVVMTSGPRKGKRYARVSKGFLRLLGPDGKETSLRCVRATRNNS